MALTEAQALQQLTRMVAANTDPVLPLEDLRLLLAMVSLEDSAGRAPSDVDWEPTYHLVKAAVEGWRWKAGMTSDLTTVRTGDVTYEDETAQQHCLRMVQQYQRMLTFGITITNSDFATTTVDEEA